MDKNRPSKGRMTARNNALIRNPRACCACGYVQKVGGEAGKPRVLAFKPYLYATNIGGKSKGRLLHGPAILICEACAVPALLAPEAREGASLKLWRAVRERFIGLYNRTYEAITA